MIAKLLVSKSSVNTLYMCSHWKQAHERAREKGDSLHKYTIYNIHMPRIWKYIANDQTIGIAFYSAYINNKGYNQVGRGSGGLLRTYIRVQYQESMFY